MSIENESVFKAKIEIAPSLAALHVKFVEFTLVNTGFTLYAIVTSLLNTLQGPDITILLKEVLTVKALGSKF